ncbi:MAG TPA: hypothetical protein VGI85_09510, partial [Chthoniobacterales bacterium]
MKFLSTITIALVTLSFAQTASTMSPPAQTSQPRQLSLADRVAYQHAIEEVYWRHRIWPKENASPKPSLDEVMSPSQIENKVENYLRNSQALKDYWQRPITAEQLQAEMERMAQHTKQPEMLHELFKALGDDPFVIGECLARPALADRLVRSWYADDQRFHGQLKQRAEADLQAHASVQEMKQLGENYTETEFVKSEDAQEKASRGVNPEIKLNNQTWDEKVQKLAAMFDRTAGHPLNETDPAIAERRPSLSGRPRQGEQAQVAPNQSLPVGKLSSLQEDQGRFYAIAVLSKTNDHLRIATVAWPKETLESWLARAENGTPEAMATAGANYRLPTISDGNGCSDDTWAATPNPTPDGRGGHTAVWTGSEMIIWGGYYCCGNFLNTGGRYNPSTDSWTFTSTTNAPDGRELHTAVWTGSEMIVWGGIYVDNSGGKYTPSTDSWT